MSSWILFLCSLAAGRTVSNVDAQAAAEGLDQQLLEQTLATFKKGPVPLKGFLEHLCLANEVIPWIPSYILIYT